MTWSDLHLNPSSCSQRMGLENASRKGRPRNPTEYFCRGGVIDNKGKKREFTSRKCSFLTPLVLTQEAYLLYSLLDKLINVHDEKR